jgi:hypothetical protein
MINEIGSKEYQANKLDNNFGTEGVPVFSMLCPLAIYCYITLGLTEDFDFVLIRDGVILGRVMDTAGMTIMEVDMKR